MLYRCFIISNGVKGGRGKARQTEKIVGLWRRYSVESSFWYKYLYGAHRARTQ